MTRDKTITRSLETLRTIHIDLDQRRTVKNVSYKINDPDYDTTLELDSHADTCVLGHDALIILDYQQPVTVVGYDESLGTKTYVTVSGAVAYDDPQTGRTLHLVIHQAIHIPHLDHHLLCHMQCCVNDVIANNLPKFLASDPTDQMHVLTIKDPKNSLQPVTLLSIFRGVTLLLYVRPVTIDEFNSLDHSRLHLTSV